jgi:type IV secretion system protein VirB6
MFNTLGGWFATFFAGYVAGVVQTLSMALIPVALGCVTIYVANYGYAVIRGEVPQPLETFVWKAMKIAFILAFALGAGVYMRFVFNTADAMQDGMSAIFLRGGEYNGSAPGTVFASLDEANNRANDLEKKLWVGAGIWRVDLILASVVFNFGNAAFLIVGAAVALLSKLVLAFGLSIGPIAILCLLFKPTARFFESWLSLILSAVVLSWFVFFGLGVSLYVVDQLLEVITLSSAFTTGGVAGVAANAIAAAWTYLMVMVLLAVLLYQMPQLAAQLTGGASVQMGQQMVLNTLIAIRAMGGMRGGGGPGGSQSGGGTMRQLPGPQRTGGTVRNVQGPVQPAYQRVASRGNGS